MCEKKQQLHENLHFGGYKVKQRMYLIINESMGYAFFDFFF